MLASFCASRSLRRALRSSLKARSHRSCSSNHCVQPLQLNSYNHDLFTNDTLNCRPKCIAWQLDNKAIFSVFRHLSKRRDQRLDTFSYSRTQPCQPICQHLHITISRRHHHRSSFIKLPLAKAASCDGRVHLFVGLFVCLSVCRQIAKTRFSQKQSNLEPCSLLTIYRKSYSCFSKNPLLDP